MDRDVVAAGVLDAPQVQHLRPAGGHLEHLLVGDARQPARGRHDPRVGGEDAVDVGVDLADLGVQGCGQRDGRGVGAAAAERGDLLGVLRDALEAGDDDDRALVQRRPDPARRDVDDPRLAVAGVGDDPGLAAGVRPGLVAQVGDRHREQRHRDALARGEQHVQLAAARQRADLLGEVDQLVGGVAHRRHGDHDVVAGLAGVDDALGDPLDALGVGDRRAAVLLHDQAHDGPPRRTTATGALQSTDAPPSRRPDARTRAWPAGTVLRDPSLAGEWVLRHAHTPGEVPYACLRGRLQAERRGQDCLTVTSWTVSASSRSSTRIVSSIGVSSRTCETTECSARSAEDAVEPQFDR